MLNDNKAAIDDYLACIKINAGQTVAYTRLGDLLLHRQKNAEGAVGVFSEAIKQQPALVYAYVERGRAYMQLNQLELALKDLNEAVKLNPNVAASYDFRGDIYLARRELDAAVDDYLSALKLDNKNPVFHFDFANALCSKGDYRTALKALDAAITLEPTFANAYVRRAVVHLQLGDSESSTRDLAKARELNPALGDLEVKRRDVKQLRITNASSVPIEVFVHYYTESISGNYYWYPVVPGLGKPATFQIESGRTVFLESVGKRVKGSKFRIWARNIKTDVEVGAYKDKDLVVVGPEGYISSDFEIFDYTFQN